MLKKVRQDIYKIWFVSALVSKEIFFPIRKKEASVVFLEQITFNLFFIFCFMHMNGYLRSSYFYIQTSTIFLFKKDMWSVTITLSNFISNQIQDCSIPLSYCLIVFCALTGLSVLFGLLEFCLWNLNFFPLFLQKCDAEQGMAWSQK